MSRWLFADWKRNTVEVRPPVCVCDDPDPDDIGQCGRPFKPCFMVLHAAWRSYLELDQPAPVEVGAS